MNGSLSDEAKQRTKYTLIDSSKYFVVEDDVSDEEEMGKTIFHKI